MFSSFLYMFRATMCPSSGETVFMRHLVRVILYGWLSGMQGGWWWAHSRPKHIEKINKHTKKNCAPSGLYLQDYTRKHGQQNTKIFHVPPLASAWGRTVDFNVLFTTYTLLMIRLFPKINYPSSSVSKYNC